VVMIPSELCIHCHAGGGCTPRAAFHPVIADIADEQVDGSVHGSGRGFAFAGGEERNHLAGLRGIGGAVDLIDPFALRMNGLSAAGRIEREDPRRGACQVGEAQRIVEGN